ncbi:unnamed protein product [Pelagomonas calceolata]|uniref:HD domain-containing protein n=1 Tax=Pelagomonas calceolata TaxID=35677 RepID=A0A7S4ECW2_9STRA|nr:unnamed protein product [Pelagomonas calceolata]
MATARVRRRWTLACESLEVNKTKEREWWRRVETGYGEPGRHYHTLVHIDAMLTLATDHEVQDRVAVDLATIFHDIVYDAVAGGGGRNERESAQVFVEFAQSTTMTSERINKVVEWIERTWSHDGNGLDDDGRLFMDFDMSILGAESGAYALYASQVRLEYGHVNWLYWRIGRSQFLSSSTSKNVFCTSEFAGLEGKALDNARAECLKLRLELFVAGCVGVAGLGVAGRVMLSLL